MDSALRWVRIVSFLIESVRESLRDRLLKNAQLQEISVVIVEAVFSADLSQQHSGSPVPRYSHVLSWVFQLPDPWRLHRDVLGDRGFDIPETQLSQ